MRPAEAEDRPSRFKIALHEQGQSQVPMRLGIIRPQGNRLIQTGDGIGKPSQAKERAAEIVVRLSEIRAVGDGAA